MGLRCGGGKEGPRRPLGWVFGEREPRVWPWIRLTQRSGWGGAILVSGSRWDPRRTSLSLVEDRVLLTCSWSPAGLWEPLLRDSRLAWVWPSLHMGWDPARWPERSQRGGLALASRSGSSAP